MAEQSAKGIPAALCLVLCARRCMHISGPRGAALEPPFLWGRAAKARKLIKVDRFERTILLSRAENCFAKIVSALAELLHLREYKGEK